MGIKKAASARVSRLRSNCVCAVNKVDARIAAIHRTGNGLSKSWSANALKAAAETGMNTGMNDVRSH